MKIKTFLTAAAISLAASAASANTVVCSFESCKGAKKHIVQSWIGIGFAVKTKGEKITLHKQYEDGWADVSLDKIQQTKKFTTYTYTQQRRPAEGFNQNVRYGYRMYNDGRCEAYIRSHRFRPLIGTGIQK